MKISSDDRPALILIDIQKGFDDIEYWGGQRNNLDAERNARQLLDLWRDLSMPIFHVKHCSTNPNSKLHPSSAGNDFKDLVRPLGGERIIEKNVNSAFIGTRLQTELTEAKIKKVVMAGLTTDHCVSTSVRMAANLGFETMLVADATATFCKKSIEGTTYPAELIHDTAIASLREEFATIVDTQGISNYFEYR